MRRKAERNSTRSPGDGWSRCCSGYRSRPVDTGLDRVKGHAWPRASPRRRRWSAVAPAVPRTARLARRSARPAPRCTAPGPGSARSKVSRARTSSSGAPTSAARCGKNRAMTSSTKPSSSFLEGRTGARGSRARFGQGRKSQRCRAHQGDRAATGSSPGAETSMHPGSPRSTSFRWSPGRVIAPFALPASRCWLAVGPRSAAACLPGLAQKPLARSTSGSGPRERSDPRRV
jgi:hypothetical protein